MADPPLRKPNIYGTKGKKAAKFNQIGIKFSKQAPASFKTKPSGVYTWEESIYKANICGTRFRYTRALTLFPYTGNAPK
jgi:hypothetical protein